MKGDTKAIDTSLRIIVRRANLLGLDTPKKVEVDIRSQLIEDARGMGMTEAEAIATVEEFLRDARR